MRVCHTILREYSLTSSDKLSSFSTVPVTPTDSETQASQQICRSDRFTTKICKLMLPASNTVPYSGVLLHHMVPATMFKCIHQGCSLGLERLGLEAVSRRFFGTSRLGLEG